VRAAITQVARQSVALLHPSDTYLQLHVGQRNTVPLSTTRRLIHCQVTGWRKRTSASGFTRVRFDPDADVMRVGFGNETGHPEGITQPQLLRHGESEYL
jgi:hypothetical protein